MHGLRPRRLIGTVVVLSEIAAGCGALPSLEEAERKAPPVPQTSILHSADRQLITTFHAEQNRVPIALRRIPATLQDAVVAIEDKRFWQHRGIDLKALLRAMYVNALQGRVAEGGSTITQQYVKNTLLGRERTLSRKIDEAALAYQLEKRYSKREILERYLNTVYFGLGAYGIQAAARKFFRKPPEDVTLAESALLAGLIAGPERYDPVDRPDRARARRGRVLHRMLELGMISATQFQSAVEDPLGVRPARNRRVYPAPYFVDYLKEWMLDNPNFGEREDDRIRFLFEGGLRIESTVSLRLQAAAEAAITSIIDYDSGLRGALVAIDPRNGHVRAMVGGRDFFARKDVDSNAKVNLATGRGGTGRQTGSAFKMFTLAAAIDKGISLRSVFSGPSPVHIKDPQCGLAGWSPKNYGGGSYGAMDLVSATASSVNTIFAQLVMKVGPENVVDMAHRLGIESPLDPVCSITLGTEEVNPLEMAASFATLAAGGIRRRPTPIDRLVGPDGKVLQEWGRSRGTRVVDKNVVNQVVYALQRVVTGGTGTNANLGPWVAGKTGTTDDRADVYFCGITPILVACVWAGYPDSRRDTGLASSMMALIWRRFMEVALAGKEIPLFPPPIFTGTPVRGPIIGPSPTPTPSPTPSAVPPSAPPPPPPSPPPPPPPPPSPSPEPSPTPT